jgi:integrase
MDKPLKFLIPYFPLYPCLSACMRKTAYHPLTALPRLRVRQLPKDRISKRSVDVLVCPPGKDREFLWDDALAGFGVVAFPSGKKSYVAQFRRAGRSRRSVIGDHGRLTPDEARSAAKRLLGAVEQGVDPIAAKRAERSVPTFSEIASSFLESHVRTKRKARTGEGYEILLRRHILPAMGGMRITDVSRVHVSRLHASISSAAPGAANRAVSLISAIWNWAARRDEASFDKNPAQGVERNREQGKERYLTAAELGRLGDALRLAETEGLPWEPDKTKPKAKHAPKPDNRRTLADPFAVAAIRLLIMTGARLREILHAEWRDLDRERGMIHLPDSKTGRKPIYLSAAALTVLTDLPRLAGNPFIIPGAKKASPRADLKNPWAAVCAHAGLEGVRIHDLRHSFASIGAGSGMGLPLLGRLLGHRQPVTTQKYAHLDADPLRKAVNSIGATIDAAMKGGQGGGKVVTLPKTRG